MKNQERINGGIWGAILGDTLGVPVEFKSRMALVPQVMRHQEIQRLVDRFAGQY